MPLTPEQQALREAAAEPAMRWPFVESPGEFAARLDTAMMTFGGDTLAAVRNVLIENPATLAAAAVEPDRRRCKQCNATRGGTHCWKCGTETFTPDPRCGDDPALPPLDRIRELAKEVGYAIGLHGSQQRDLDVIAAPWSPDAVDADALLAHVAQGLVSDNGPAHIINTERKPLGRYAATIQMDGWYKNLDISVCPAQPSVHVFARTKEAALQALADQAQELGMGYEGMVMPSPPGSAGDADAINTLESLSAADGSMEDFADAADLVDAMTSTEAKGDALGLVLAYRHKVRAAALSQPVQAVPDERKE